MPILKPVFWNRSLHYTASHSGLRNQASFSNMSFHLGVKAVWSFSPLSLLYAMCIQSCYFPLDLMMTVIVKVLLVTDLLRNCGPTFSARVQVVYATALFCRAFICEVCYHYQKCRLQLSTTLTHGLKCLAKSKTSKRKRSDRTSEQGVLLPLIECAFISFQSCGKQLLGNL